MALVRLSDIPYVPAKLGQSTVDEPPANIIFLHGMVAPPNPGIAKNWASYLSKPPSGQGKYWAQLIVDPFEYRQSGPLNRRAPHIGNANTVHGRYTLGIEQSIWCTEKREDYNSGNLEKVLNNTAILLRCLIDAGYGAAKFLSPAELKVPGARGISTHNNARIAFGGTTHTDPGDGYPIDKLMALVNGPFIPGPVTPPPYVPVKDVNMIASAYDAPNKVMNRVRVTGYGTVQLSWQKGPNMAFGPWVDMPGVTQVSRGVAICPDVDGRLEILAYAEDYSVYQCWQKPGGGWSGWTKT